jgi:5S rRNA maturation endonuclease (ribonuclease M5)
MSITHVVNIKQDLNKIFGENQGVWEYRNFENEFICYTVRTQHLHKGNWEKRVTPWTFQENKWMNKFFENVPNKLIYNEHLLKIHPEKTVLIVEGEKTTDAGTQFFPDYVCISWMGGCKAVKKVILDNLKNRKIILVPDNDEGGYEAMEYLYQELRKLDCDVAFVDIKRLGVGEKWDIADLNDDYGVIASEDVFDLIHNTSFNNKDMPIYYKLMDKMSFPDLSPKFNPINTSENIAHLSQFYKLNIRFNLMTKDVECEAEGQLYSLQNKSDCFFVYLSNLCVRNGVPKIDLHNHLTFIADKNRYHPAIEWIESKSWDGVSRIHDFLNTIQSDNQEFSNKLLYRWMLGSIAALYTDGGVSLEGMLIIQGAQKIGKSYWFINLVPKNKRHLIIDGESMNSNNRDDIKKVTGRWLCELAEIESTIKQSGNEELKKFITRSEDTYRAAYARTDKTYPRMTSFYGSVNNSTFLTDQTGNRRFWCIPATSINFDHKMDMQQVWAEFKILYDKGESYRLSDEEQNAINQENETFTIRDYLEESIIDAFDWSSPYRLNPMSSKDVLSKLGIDIKNHTIDNLSRKIGSILSKLTQKKGRRSNSKIIYDMPDCLIVKNINNFNY